MYVRHHWFEFLAWNRRHLIKVRCFSSYMHASTIRELIISCVHFYLILKRHIFKIHLKWILTMAWCALLNNLGLTNFASNWFCLSRTIGKLSKGLRNSNKRILIVNLPHINWCYCASLLFIPDFSFWLVIKSLKVFLGFYYTFS